MSDQEDAEVEREQVGKNVYMITHQAFKTEYIVATTPEEAERASSSEGWDTGDYTYGEYGASPHPIGPIEELLKIDQIGETTVGKLKNAKSPVSLSPSSNPNSISKSEVTRLRRRLEMHSGVLDAGKSYRNRSKSNVE